MNDNFVFNEYGEKITIKDGYVYHSDIDNIPCKLFDGFMVGRPNSANRNDYWLVGEDGHMYIISKDERDLIIDLIGNNKIEVCQSDCTFLSWNYCPCCWLQFREAERHHVVAKSGGGSNNPTNLLLVCNTCHSRMTRGDVADRMLNIVCKQFMRAIYGIIQLEEERISKYEKYFSDDIFNYYKEHPEECKSYDVDRYHLWLFITKNRKMAYWVSDRMDEGKIVDWEMVIEYLNIEKLHNKYIKLTLSQ